MVVDRKIGLSTTNKQNFIFIIFYLFIFYLFHYSFSRFEDKHVKQINKQKNKTRSKHKKKQQKTKNITFKIKTGE